MAKKTSTKKHKRVNKKKLATPPSHEEVSKPANKTNNAMADIHTYINDTMTANHKYIFNRCRRIYQIHHIDMYI
jgi:hypothetical protein